jgi:hypothetical protein
VLVVEALGEPWAKLCLYAFASFEPKNDLNMQWQALFLCFSRSVARALDELPNSVVESENVLLSHLHQIDEQRKVRVCYAIG